jgi:hypothetical protein
MVLETAKTALRDQPRWATPEKAQSLTASALQIRHSSMAYVNVIKVGTWSSP